MKVKVSKEVAEILEKVKKESFSNILGFMWYLNDKNNRWSSEFMRKHNLTDDDLINAYKYGWEVEYKFQSNDVVIIDNSSLPCILRGSADCELANSGQRKITLVCKAENREDLKQC